MKNVFKLILVLIFFSSCSNQKNQKEIEIFEDTLGQNNVEVLNLLVEDFEANLEKHYPQLEMKDAYRQYLLDLKSNSSEDYSKFLFLSDETFSIYRKSELRNELYEYSFSIDESTNDSIFEYEVNNLGKYMHAIYNVKDSDSLINKYYEVREAFGIITNSMFVDGFLYSKPDFDNYFHKRIVVIEYSY